MVRVMVRFMVRFMGGGGDFGPEWPLSDTSRGSRHHQADTDRGETVKTQTLPLGVDG